MEEMIYIHLFHSQKEDETTSNHGVDSNAPKDVQVQQGPLESRQICMLEDAQFPPNLKTAWEQFIYDSCPSAHICLRKVTVPPRDACKLGNVVSAPDYQNWVIDIKGLKDALLFSFARYFRQSPGFQMSSQDAVWVNQIIQNIRSPMCRADAYSSILMYQAAINTLNYYRLQLIAFGDYMAKCKQRLNEELAFIAMLAFLIKDYPAMAHAINILDTKDTGLDASYKKALSLWQQYKIDSINIQSFADQIKELFALGASGNNRDDLFLSFLFCLCRDLDQKELSREVFSLIQTEEYRNALRAYLPAQAKL